MKRNIGKLVLGCMLSAAGAALIGCAAAGMLDSFWSGVGGGMCAVGILQLVKTIRCIKDSGYREKNQRENADERNHFLNRMAAAWTLNCYAPLCCVASLVLYGLQRKEAAFALGYSVCAALLLYLVFYLILRKKY